MMAVTGIRPAQHRGPALHSRLDFYELAVRPIDCICHGHDSILALKNEYMGRRRRSSLPLLALAQDSSVNVGRPFGRDEVFVEQLVNDQLDRFPASLVRLTG
jgi:hypothetical protein